MSSTSFYGSQSLVGVGAIGIGTTSSVNPLSVNGGAMFGAYYGSAAPANGIAVSGAVGIGTTNPGANISLDIINPVVGSNLPFMRIGGGGGAGNQVGINLAPYTPRGGGPPVQIVATDDGNSSAYLTFLVAATGGGSTAAERMRINNAGNVGIGTTNPTAPLAVYATTGQNSSIISFTDSVYGSFNFSLNTAAGAYNNFTAPGDALLWVTKGVMNTGCMTIAPHSSGSLGIRIASTANTLSAGANTYSFVSNTSGTAMMTILGNGNVGIGTTSPGRILSVAGGATNTGPVVFDCTVSSGFTDVAFLVRVAQTSATTYALAMFQANGGSDTRCFIRGDGNLYNTNNSYGAISDRNLKENIVPARSYMDDLNKLQVVKFSFKAEESPVPTQLGLIAQDVSEVFPGLVDTDNDGNKNLKYSILNMMMLKTVQELSATVQTQQTAISSLEQSLGSLEARLAALEAK